MFNKVILVGRLCTDPKLKYTPSGVAVANFRIAVDRQFANVNGERETDFIDVVVWRQSAEFVNTYVTKGRLVLVDGRLQVRQWQGTDGQTRRSTEVVADTIRTLDRPKYDDAPKPPADYVITDPVMDSPIETIGDYDMPDDITDPFADQ